MGKHYFFIFFLVIILLMVTGCSKNNTGTIDNQENKQQNQTQEVSGNLNTEMSKNFLEASLGDLEVGQKVLVMGVENTGGSITANQIVIGGSEIDFGELDRNMMPRERSGEENGNNIQNQMPQGSQEQRPNLEQFQNMSEEERMKMREEMMAQRGLAGSARIGNTGQAVIRLNGEILDRDDVSIVLKLESGGSKIIFLSEKTKILKPKPLE